MIRQIRQHIRNRLPRIMRQERRQPRDSHIAHIGVPIPLGRIMQHQLPQQALSQRVPRLGVVGAEHIRAQVVRVHAVEPPLRELRVGALEPAGEGVGCAEEGGEPEGERGDGDAALGRGEGLVGVEGVKRDAEVAEAVEPVGADAVFGLLAAELVDVCVGVCLDGDLGRCVRKGGVVRECLKGGWSVPGPSRR